MPWTALIPLITDLGLPAVQFIIKEIEGGNDATSATLSQVAAMANLKAKDEMLTVLKAQNIDPTSPAGIALLALTQ
jgi:hypothetical protein